MKLFYILKTYFHGKVLTSDCGKDGHYIFLVLETANVNYNIVSVYGFNPQSEYNAFIDGLKKRRLLHWLSNFFMVFHNFWWRF